MKTYIDGLKKALEILEANECEADGYHYCSQQDTYKNLIKAEIESLPFEAVVSLPSRTLGEWYKPEDLPEDLISGGLETVRLIVKYKIRNKIFVDFGHKTKYDWRVSGSPSSWNDEILGWMPLPKP